MRTSGVNDTNEVPFAENVDADPVTRHKQDEVRKEIESR